VNDLEGTVVREKIYHEAGAHTAQAMTLDALLALIRGAGKEPAERDSFYRIVRRFVTTSEERSDETRGELAPRSERDEGSSPRTVAA
jgi:hypothetical protein